MFLAAATGPWDLSSRGVSQPSTATNPNIRSEPLHPARPVVVRPEPVAASSQPRCPGFLFFGACRRSGTTWVASLLNANPQLHIRNEGWLFNDRGGSFDTWLNLDRFNAWASGPEARGTWLRDTTPAEAARIMQQAMLRTLFQEATRREGWKDWSSLRWCGDKTTMFYNSNIDALATIFPPEPPAAGSPRSPARFLSMVRDGRDCVVSNLFLIFREQRWDKLPADARPHALRAFEFHGKGIGKPIPLFDPPLLRFLVHEWIAAVAGARRAAEIYGPHGGFHEVKYEDLIADTPARIRDVYRWLGVSDAITDARLSEIIDDCKFENFSGGRRRGEADPLAEWRKGISGDWRNHFTEDDKRLFKAVAGSLLVELGYERGLDW